MVLIALCLVHIQYVNMMTTDIRHLVLLISNKNATHDVQETSAFQDRDRAPLHQAQRRNS
jgi:hypothetical protein